jgi:hypothetical protein
MFIIILIIILVIIYFIEHNFYCIIGSKDNFNSGSMILPSTPYNPPIQTPISNFNEIYNKIQEQLAWKKDLSVALVPTPTIHCDELKNKEDCNKYGCNWFSTFCSSTYPMDF